MKKRQWAIIGGVAIIALALFLNKILSNTQQEKKPENKLPVKGVEVILVKNGDVPVMLHMDGKLNALDKVELYAEVNGILQSGNKKFEEGIEYRKGETLLRLENSEARANYLAAQSEYINLVTQALPDIKLDYPESYEEWRNYLSHISGTNSIDEPPAVNDDKLRLFLTGRGVYSGYQNLESARIRLTKYRITAPFNGIITEANLDPGTLVRAGQRLGEFINPGAYELETSISSNDLGLIKIGDTVSLTSPDREGQWKGEVFRINAKVDPNTQRVKVFIRVIDESLRDGMFMNAIISGQPIQNSFRMARKLIYNETYTYVVNDTVLALRKLDILKKNPNTVIARGLNDGDKVPDQPIPGAHEGMKVRVVGITDGNNSAAEETKNQEN